MDFKLVPSIALKDGKPHFLYSRSGEEKKYEPGEDLEDAVENLGEDYGSVHVLDLGGIENDELNYELIEDLSGVATIWVECGSANVEGVMDAMFAGSEYIIIGTRFLRRLEDLKKIFEITENAIFAVEWDGGIVSASKDISMMSVEELGKKVKEIGIDKFMFTDVERIKGKTGSVNYVSIHDLVSCGVEVYASGGCVPDDKDALVRLSAVGMIIEAGLLPASPKKERNEEGKEEGVGDE
jgi:phosphoribosylformimino-5-aminoimidazole carboxamide ribonucleotide (ProFAR) isomerase